MKIGSAVALVTGANRGLGRVLARELLDRGAAKVYAGARDTATIADEEVVPVELDVTDHDALARTAAWLSDVSLVINNAGIATQGRPLTAELDAVRRDLEVNHLGPLAVAQNFAPVLAANGGGALVNILSVYAWVTVPPMSVYAASKAAAWSMTNALRLQLRGPGTLVVGVHMDSVDTDMTAGWHGPKHAPADVARAVLDAVEAGQEEVLLDDYTRTVKASLRDDLRLLYE
ncbi:SDR family oxidoreductase [Streptomyces sp. BK205]|uniref:SDR family oxidoreductase n=1 Tax=Streptomyces sp. BK205 TaxID=2512164 RepID=UPI0010525F56|nr:SDR family oxidoreductase [Streptomyces sp. BK205]TCR16043.1 short-subunit dehydrogenase [Streptomyces sp. BK205]